MRCRLTLALLGLLTLSGCGGESERESNAIGGQVTAASFNADNDPTIEFDVPDMMCPDGCGVAVDEILSKQPGAKDVLVDFDSKTATVAIDESKFDSDKALAALVDKQFSNSSLKTTGGAKLQPADSKAVQ